MQTVTVRQPANLGVVLPRQAFDLQADGTSIEVEVRANVQYSVSTSADWIKQTGTKGLTSKTLTFSIEENKTYDSREGKITIKPQGGSVQEQVISVRQAQKDALNVEKTSYEMPYGGGEIEIKVEANVDFDVKPSVDWIHYVETKALNNSTVRLVIDENPMFDKREGTIEITQKNGSLSHTINVKQAERIAVSSVILNKTSLNMCAGTFETLVATVKPDNATDKTVTWSSSNPEVASVDDSGEVTALREGSATITAKAGEKTADCIVTVFVAVSYIELSETSVSLMEGETATLSATVMPDNATDKTVTWSSSNEKIATVENGKITAIKVGEATIIASAGDKKAECKVTVTPVPVSSVTLDQSEVELEVGQSVSLVATVEPDNATDKTITWSSSDDSIAKVDVNGIVTALEPGEAIISANSGEQSAECLVTVKLIPVSSVTLDNTSLKLKVGKTARLTATVMPDNATDKAITWTSSDESIATVSEEGLVTAQKRGKVTITAQSSQDEIYATCEVQVYDNDSEVGGGHMNYSEGSF